MALLKWLGANGPREAEFAFGSLLSHASHVGRLVALEQLHPVPPPEAAGGPGLCRELVTASRDPGGRLRAASKLQEGGGGPAGPGSPCIDGPGDDSVTRAGGGVHSMARGQTKVSTCPEEPEVSPEWVHNQTPKWEGSRQAGQRAGALRRSKAPAGKLGWGPPQSRTPARGGGGHTWL